jgi:hypothetical protein
MSTDEAPGLKAPNLANSPRSDKNQVAQDMMSPVTAIAD